MIRKIVYGDADYILTLFTRDFGKIRGFAKNAKTSKKRFGGRLEPFVHFRVRIRDKSRDMRFVEDAETVHVFHNIMENIELFLWGSFILETVDSLLPGESPVDGLFELLVETLSEIDSGISTLPVVLSFQLKALTLSGYEPNFGTCAECGIQIEGEAQFSLSKGGVICRGCTGGVQNGFRVSRQFLSDRAIMEIHLGKVLKYIKLFTKFTEFHTEKELKSAKFIEELQI